MCAISLANWVFLLWPFQCFMSQIIEILKLGIDLQLVRGTGPTNPLNI